MFDVTIVDLSSLGLCAEHTHEVQTGNVYELHLRLPPHPRPLQVKAKVVWTMPFRIEQTRGERRTIHRSGFEFVTVAPQTAAALEACVAEFMGGKTEAPAATARA